VNPSAFDVTAFPADATSREMPQLDSLRFFAALGVIFTHLWHPRGLPWLLDDLGLEWAALGVRLFFVLSGFLITGILLDCREHVEHGQGSRLFVLRRFYVRRFLRICPIYYLFVGFALLVDLAPAREIWMWLVSYTSNIYITTRDEWIGRFGHFWTLAVEEQFYLLWPWLVLFVRRRWLVAVSGLLIAVAPIYRYWAYAAFPFDIGAMDFRAATFTFASLDTLGAGALLAVAWRSDTARRSLPRLLTRWLLPAGVALYLTLLLLYHYRVSPRAFFTLGDTASAMMFAWLVGAAASGFGGLVRRILTLQPLRYLGRISYGIYVFHMFVPLLVLPVLEAVGITPRVPGFANFLVSGSVTLVVAMLSWTFVESPINRLKHRFPYVVRDADRPEAAD
jgi:peptidoglycan/LPS O-acetylase OafA/YrhL